MTVSRPPRRAAVYQILLLLASLALLAVVLALFLTGTLSLRPRAEDNPSNPPEEIPPALMTDYRLPRAAVNGVNCIGGAGSDRAVASFTLGDFTYTAGETDSRDADMAGAPEGRNLFVAVSDQKNIVRHVAVFGGVTDDTLVDVQLGGDGLKVLAQSSANANNLALYTFGYQDYEVKKTEIRFNDRLIGKSLLVYGAHCYVFSDNYSAGTDYHQLIVHCLEGDTPIFVHTVNAAAVSYEFFAVYPVIDGVAVLINAREGNFTYPAIARMDNIDYQISPIERYEDNTRIIASYPYNGGYRMLLSTAAGSRLISVDAADSVRKIAVYPKRGTAAVFPFRNKECVVFFEENSACYLTADGRTVEQKFDSPIADARMSMQGAELLLRGADTLSVFALGDAVSATVAVKLETAKFGNDRFVYGTMRAGMGGLDAALVELPFSA